MIKTIKTVLYTLMLYSYLHLHMWYTYKAKSNKNKAKELEIEEVVETLEEITRCKKPDFERANNQTFIDSVGQCVEYIYNTTTDVIPVNLELLLGQAALESGWGNSRFALEGKNYLVFVHTI